MHPLLRRPTSPYNLAKKLIADSLVNLDPTGIVGSPNPTEWVNSGTGGADYSPNVVVGTGANLTLGSLNGHTTIVSAGSAGIESTAGQDIAQPLTVFVVGGHSTPNGDFIGSRSDINKQVRIGNIFATTKTFADAGNTIQIASPDTDTNPHIFTFQVNGASSTLTVSDFGEIAGNAGSNAWDFGTVLHNYAGTASLIGFMAQLLVFNRALNPTEIAAIQSYLAIKFAL